MIGKLLVTGASGYLGAELMLQAPEARGIHGSRSVARSARVDVRDGEEVARAVAGHDCVIHTAYRQSGLGAWAVTVDGSAAVARAAAAAGARLVHVSTDVVFDGRLGRPYREPDEPRPLTEYGRAKLAAERAVAAHCPAALIVRTSLIYGGPDREPSRQEEMALEPGARFFSDELRSPVAVADLAGALLELAAGDVSGPLHVAGADHVSRYELACLVAAARGHDPGSVGHTTIAASGIERPADCRLDSSRAGELLRDTRLRGVRELLGS